jgi:hypothetical protein
MLSDEDEEADADAAARPSPKRRARLEEKIEQLIEQLEIGGRGGKQPHRTPGGGAGAGGGGRPGRLGVPSVGEDEDSEEDAWRDSLTSSVGRGGKVISL